MKSGSRMGPARKGAGDAQPYPTPLPSFPFAVWDASELQAERDSLQLSRHCLTGRYQYTSFGRAVTANGRKAQYALVVLTTDLVEIARLGVVKQTENIHFRRYLAAHHHRIEELQAVAGEVAHEIDCTVCANCCRQSIVNVTAADIASIAAHLGIDPAEAEHRSTEPDPEDSSRKVLRSTRDGCIFLHGNLCSIYDHRPQACRDFPHIAQGTHSLGGRVESLCRWAALCPIIYNAIEIYKHQVGYHPAQAANRVSAASDCET